MLQRCRTGRAGRELRILWGNPSGFESRRSHLAVKQWLKGVRRRGLGPLCRDDFDETLTRLRRSPGDLHRYAESRASARGPVASRSRRGGAPSLRGQHNGPDGSRRFRSQRPSVEGSTPKRRATAFSSSSTEAPPAVAGRSLAGGGCLAGIEGRARPVQFALGDHAGLDAQPLGQVPLEQAEVEPRPSREDGSSPGDAACRRLGARAPLTAFKPQPTVDSLVR